MEKEKFEKVFESTSFDNEESVNDHLEGIRKAQKLLDYGATGILEKNDERIFEPLRELAYLQENLEIIHERLTKIK